MQCPYATTAVIIIQQPHSLTLYAYLPRTGLPPSSADRRYRSSVSGYLHTSPSRALQHQPHDFHNKTRQTPTTPSPRPPQPHTSQPALAKQHNATTKAAVCWRYAYNVMAIPLTGFHCYFSATLALWFWYASVWRRCYFCGSGCCFMARELWWLTFYWWAG